VARALISCWLSEGIGSPKNRRLVGKKMGAGVNSQEMPRLPPEQGDENIIPYELPS
jgi:hypothetical protein